MRRRLKMMLAYWQMVETELMWAILTFWKSWASVSFQQLIRCVQDFVFQKIRHYHLHLAAFASERNKKELAGAQCNTVNGEHLRMLIPTLRTIISSCLIFSAAVCQVFFILCSFMVASMSRINSELLLFISLLTSGCSRSHKVPNLMQNLDENTLWAL